MIKKLIPLAALLAIILCPLPSRAEVVNKIVAVVNNDIITERDLLKAMAMKDRGRTPVKEDQALRQETLDGLIDEALFNQLMLKSKIEVSSDDLARAIANVLHQNNMSLDQLKKEVAAKGIGYEEYKSQMERDIKRAKFINQVIGPQVKITDQDLRDFYQRNQDKFRGSQKAHIAEIVFPLEGISTQEDFNKLRDLTMSIAAKAKHGTSFESLAKQYSKGPAAEEGGDLGMINLKDLPPEVGVVVRGLKVGEVSNPFGTGNALVIAKLISLPELASGDFEKLRDEIYNAIYEQKMEETVNNFLMKERSKAFIEIR